MFRIFYFLLSALSVVHSVSTFPVTFFSSGESASVTCQCSIESACYEQHIIWIRVHPNGSLDLINTGSEKTGNRYASKLLSDSFVQLTIASAEPGDSGRYYCGMNIGNYVSFLDKETILNVGDVWTNSSKVMMLAKWANDSRSADLRCVVTGLSAPWVEVIWRNSGERNVETRVFTWTLAGSLGEYHVTSQLHVHADLSWDEYDRYYEKTWWCEVHVGVNHSHSSPKFSFLQQSEELDWCSALLYTVVTLCVLCVCLLTALSCHCLYNLRTGSTPQADVTVSALRDTPTDVDIGVTYAEMNIEEPSRNSRLHTGRDKRAERVVYSEVRYKLRGNLPTEQTEPHPTLPNDCFQAR